MPTMGPSEFIRKAGQGKLGPAYFLRGPDAFLQEECRTALVGSIPADARPWCLTEIEFESGRLRRQLESASQMPMLGGHSFFIFSDPEDFGHAGEADYEALDSYFERPSSFATVVFLASEPDRRRRFIQLLEKKAELVELKPLGRKEAAGWLAEYLGRQKVEIVPELAEAVISRFESSADPRGGGASGVNLLWVRTEIEKILTSRPDSRRIEASDLELLVGFREEHVIGKLLRAIAERKFARALEELRALLASQESEILLLWSIGDLFRQTLKLAGPAGRRAPGYGAKGGGGWNRWSNPFSTEEIARDAARAYSYPEQLQALKLVRQADLGIKSSWKDSKILLEFLIWQVVVGKGPKSIPAFELPAPSAEA
jgi:DNA polymerase III subunit delta